MLLDAAIDLEDATEKPIINPHDFTTASLFMMDTEWRRDLFRRRQWLKYMRDHQDLMNQLDSGTVE